jgi:hypothetical protein
LCGPAGLWSSFLEIGRAWEAHDPESLRGLYPADFYIDDRRRTGVGRIEGLDAYLASIAALWDLSSDLRLEILYQPDTGTHGTLYVSRWVGTNAEGGEFEIVFVGIGILRDHELAGLEIFEIDDLELARARFAELATGRKS